MGSRRTTADTNSDQTQPPAPQPQRGSIQWFLAQQQQQQAATTTTGSNQQQQPEADLDAASRPFKQPRLQLERVQQQHQRPCKPHLALRSSNHCQQLLVQELGWRCPPSLNTWHQSQQLQLACVCLRACPHLSPAEGFRMGAKTSLPLTCLDVQRSYNNSMSSSSNALAAVGDAHGVLHVCRLSRLQAASASALNAAAALPPDVREALMDPVRWARRAMAVEGVPTGAGAIPSASAAAGPGGASVLRLDTQEQLRSCCWLQRQHNAGTAASSGSEGVLVTSGRSGLVKRVFAEGRQASSSLRAKGGSMVEAAGTVVALDGPQGAYHLAAVAGKSLLLWDLRAGPAAAATLPLQAPPAVVRALPQGQVLLAADANGQVCLYDVRRMSNSSIVNFGSSRASQQLLMTHNLRARAQAAGFASTSSGSSSVAAAASLSYGVATLDSQFLCDVVVNPTDPNLAAYIRPQLQAGLFDLTTGRVLQQVSLLQQLDADSFSHGASALLSSSSNSQLNSSLSSSGLPVAAGGQGCWDSSGRILYTQGMLQYVPQQQQVLVQDASGAGMVTSTAAGGVGGGGSLVCPEAAVSLAAVDFGSWHGRRLRWSGAGGPAAAAGAGAGGSGESRVVSSGAGAGSSGVSADGDDAGGGDDIHSGSGVGDRWSGRLRVCQGGQVVHRELHWTAAPTVLAAAGGAGGEMLAGTRTGDVLWLG